MKHIRVVGLLFLSIPALMLIIAGFGVGLAGKIISRLGIFGLDVAILCATWRAPASIGPEIARLRGRIRGK